MLRTVLGLSVVVLLGWLALSHLKFGPTYIERVAPTTNTRTEELPLHVRAPAQVKRGRPKTNTEAQLPAVPHSQSGDFTDDPPEPTNPAHMSSADWELRKSLIGERNAIIGQLKTDQELLQILSPLRSYDERSEAYCRYEMDHSISFLAGRSLARLRARYQSLLEEKPETAEGEQQRQMGLRVVGEQIEGYLSDVQTCKWLLLNGNRRLRTNDEIQNAITEERGRIAEIDRNLVLNGQ